MQKQSGLSLNAAAWFFVAPNHELGAPKNVQIYTPFQIGRRPDVNLCLPCASVSGLHAEIVDEDGSLWIYDLGSTNGTFVNGERIKDRLRLNEGDTVQFGTTVFHVNRKGDEPVASKPASSRIPKSRNEKSQQADPKEYGFQRLLQGGVVPFFQPIVELAGTSDIEKPSIIGYEVLGRSRLFGLRTPAQMFAAASQLEMEAELSRVLRSQGIKIADQNLDVNKTLYVNSHPSELVNDGLEDSLLEIRESCPSRPIAIELHESILNSAESFIDLSEKLRDNEIQLALHDFGCGQIQLSELNEISPDFVKFGVSLIQGIDKAPAKQQKFVATLVKMVSELGITPMAECIEQSSEHETLKQIGFELVQGFLYGRPTSIADCNTPTKKIRQKRSPRIDSEVFDRPKVESGGVKDSQWLLAQPGHSYTVQVLSAISMERAQEHIARQANPDEFAVFEKQGKTRMLYIVVHGIFEDRAAAKEASAKLDDASVSPWIRMLSSVHAEIAG